MVIVASLLVGTAIYLFMRGIIFQSEGVGINEEYQATSVNKFVGRMDLLVGCLLCAVAAYIITGRLLFVGLALPGGFFVARYFRNRREKARANLLEDQFKLVLGNLITSMQGGSSPYQAFEEIVPKLPSPAKDIFIEIVRRSRTGSTLGDSLAMVAKESGWKNLESLQMAINLYDLTGYNLVEVLKHMLNNLYESIADRKYIEAMTSQIRATCLLLSGLPFLLMAVTRMMAPQFAAPLFGTTGGVVVIGIVVVMVLVGNVLVKNMLIKTINI